MNLKAKARYSITGRLAAIKKKKGLRLHGENCSIPKAVNTMVGMQTKLITWLLVSLR